MSKSKIVSVIDRYIKKIVFDRRNAWRIPLWAIEALLSMPLDSARSWKSRISDVLEAPDNRYIPRVPAAGAIHGGFQRMHNGIDVVAGQYYGLPIQLMLHKNGGVHEPQEERAFGDILKHIRPGAVMIELGAYWGFYSLWFQSEIKNATSYLIEPDPANLQAGMDNFAINKRTGTFIQALVGAAEGCHDDGRRVLSVDSLVAERNIPRIDILHSDIQGAEYEMLVGASRCFHEDRVAYVFISTHSNEVHAACINFLKKYTFIVLAEANLDDSYSLDGVIVAKAPHLVGPDSIPVSLKSKSRRTAVIELTN